MDMPACDIVIPIWNQPELTRRCLERVRAVTTSPYRLLLIDNGSEAPTRRLLDETCARDPARVQIIRNATNLGFIKAVNQGLRVSTAPFVLLLNNDTVVTPGWLKAMVSAAERDPAIGLVNPASNTFGYHSPQITVHAIESYAAAFVRRHPGEYQELPATLGFCLLMTRAVINAVGLFDEQYGLGNFEDADYTKRALARGYRCVLTFDAYVYHEEKASFKHLPRWEDGFRANQRAFYRRWGRPLRIVWDAHGLTAEELRAWEPTIARLLQQGHWLAYSAGNGGLSPEVRRYATAAPLAFSPRWRGPLLWYVLKRRKKLVDLVVTHDARLYRRLSWLRRWHRAAILQSPTPATVEALCKRLSLSP